MLAAGSQVTPQNHTAEQTHTSDLLEEAQERSRKELRQAYVIFLGWGWAFQGVLRIGGIL